MKKLWKKLKWLLISAGTNFRKKALLIVAIDKKENQKLLREVIIFTQKKLLLLAKNVLCEPRKLFFAYDVIITQKCFCAGFVNNYHHVLADESLLDQLESVTNSFILYTFSLSA